MDDFVEFSSGASSEIEIQKCRKFIGLCLIGREAKKWLQKKLERQGEITITMPCDYRYKITSDDIPKRSVKCPNSGQCGAEKCWCLKFEKENAVVGSPRKS